MFTNNEKIFTEFPLITVGTYEEFLLGYKIEKNESGGWMFKMVFSNHAHRASIRCVDSYGKFLTSSGADEFINIYDVGLMRETGVLAQHTGTVNGLKFTPDGSHLVSGSQDGSVAIFRCSDWQLVKFWKNAHESANGVTGIAVHPSGTMMSSIGADNILKMWNLVKGRMAYAKNYSKYCNQGQLLELVEWCDSGQYFAVALGVKVFVYLVSTAGILYEFQAGAKVTSLQFGKNHLLFVGTEEGVVECHSIIEQKLQMKNNCHESRVKCLKMFYLAHAADNKKKVKFYLVTADSRGCIKLFVLKKSKSIYSLEPVCDVKTDCRVTCMTYNVPISIKEEDLNKLEDVSGEVKEIKKSKKHKKVKQLAKILDTECSFIPIQEKKLSETKQSKNKVRKIKKVQVEQSDSSLTLVSKKKKKIKSAVNGGSADRKSQIKGNFKLKRKLDNGTEKMVVKKKKKKSFDKI